MNLKKGREAANRAEADAKKQKRAMDKFEKEVEENKEYFLDKWGVSVGSNIDSLSTEFGDIAAELGCSADELWRYITSPQLKMHYRHDQGNH